MTGDWSTDLAQAEDWRSTMSLVCARLLPMAVSGNANFSSSQDAAALLWKLMAAISGSLGLDNGAAFIQQVQDLVCNVFVEKILSEPARSAPALSTPAEMEGSNRGGGHRQPRTRFGIPNHPAAAEHGFGDEWMQQLGGGWPHPVGEAAQEVDTHAFRREGYEITTARVDLPEIVFLSDSEDDSPEIVFLSDSEDDLPEVEAPLNMISVTSNDYCHGSDNSWHIPAAAGHAIGIGIGEERMKRVGDHLVGEAAPELFTCDAVPQQRETYDIAPAKIELPQIVVVTDGEVDLLQMEELLTVTTKDYSQDDLTLSDGEDGLHNSVVLADSDFDGLETERTGEDDKDDLETKRVRLLEQLRQTEHRCAVCRTAFRNLSRYRMHMRRKHGDTNFTLAGPSLGAGQVACPMPGCNYTTRHKAIRPYPALRKHFDRVHRTSQAQAF